MAKVGGIGAEQLRRIVERIERLEEEKAAIASDIKDVFAEAKGNGYDIKTIKAIIKLRKMDEAEREEYEGLLDIYKAALGMLNGTPLGEAAIRRLSDEKKEDSESPEQKDNIPEVEKEDSAPEESRPEQEEAPEPTIDDAREMARKAAQEGKPVTANPFPARDARRAAWDEEWCRESGSDGMELPAAWRRNKPKQKDDDQEAA